MIVLGLDPSLTAYGWAIVDVATHYVLDAGCIRPKLAKRRTKSAPKTAGNAARLAYLARELLDVLQAWGPERVISELPMGGRNAATAKALGQSFALTVAVCELHGKPCTFVTPRAAKLRVGASLDGDKASVARGVLTRTGWRSVASSKPAREAEADAVAVALTGVLEDVAGMEGR